MGDLPVRSGPIAVADSEGNSGPVAGSGTMKPRHPAEHYNKEAKRHWRKNMRTGPIWILIALVTAPLGAYAQWVNYPDPTTPRTGDGQPNLSAPAPRVNGK